jgi:ribosomal protein L40E
VFVAINVVELLLLVVFLGGIVLLLHAIFHKDDAEIEISDFGTEMACPRCHHLNPTHANFCAHCGRRLQ